MIKSISKYIDTTIAHNHLVITKPNDNNFEFHTHDICEIIYLKSGDISAIIGEKQYKVPPKSLVIFRANIPHRIRIDSPKLYERHNVLFNDKERANGIFRKIPKDVDLINCSQNKTIELLFEKLDFYYNNFEGEDLKVLVTNIVEEILFNLYLNPNEDAIDMMIEVHPAIKNAVEYINGHYTEEITIDEVSKRACITKSHLHHLFMEYMKISPKKFINMKRLSKAQKLISAGQKPTAIYSECGFTDYGTFFRNYTNHFGYTPSQKDEIATERKIES